jgi:hypothetical protein
LVKLIHELWPVISNDPHARLELGAMMSHQENFKQWLLSARHGRKGLCNGAGEGELDHDYDRTLSGCSSSDVPRPGQQGQSDAFKGMSSKMITGGMKHIWDAAIAKALAELESRR